MSKSKLFFSFCVLAISAYAQGTTSNVFKVWQDHEKWYGQNLADEEITGYVIHAGGGDLTASSSRINAAPVELEYHPIAHLQVVELPLKFPNAMVEVPAVIFADGTVVGVARTVEGLDIVDTMFKYRLEEHNEYQHMAILLQTSDRDFHNEVVRTLPRDLDAEKRTGIGRAQGHLQGFLSSASDHDAIRRELDRRIAFTEKSSTRRAQ